MALFYISEVQLKTMNSVIFFKKKQFDIKRTGRLQNNLDA